MQFDMQDKSLIVYKRRLKMNVILPGRLFQNRVTMYINMNNKYWFVFMIFFMIICNII